MEKVLIITYYYPPCNLTASRRIESFAKYLPEHGFYPIVVTRKWENEVKNPADILMKTTKGIDVQKSNSGEIHYLPYQPCLRDRIFQKSDKVFFKFLSKILTIIQILGYSFSVKFIPFSNIYFHAKKLINKHNITKIIISANPFEIFLFGYLLKRNYRDDWNTSELPEYKNKPFFVRKIETYYEKKWVGSASIISTISPYYAYKISEFVNRPTEVILNGFEFDNNLLKGNNYNSEFTIVYLGTLYQSQIIEVVLQGFKNAVNELQSGIKIIFPGLAFDKTQADRVKFLLRGYEEYYEISDRIPFNKVLELQQRAHLMLMVPHKNIKGIPSSKLYEYIGLGKRVLLCPSDEDIIEETILDCNLGYVCTSEEGAYKMLVESVKNKKDWEATNLSVSQTSKINTYSRKHQVYKLSLLLNNL